jgi:flagellar basal body rod protein FlgG
MFRPTTCVMTCFAAVLAADIGFGVWQFQQTSDSSPTITAQHEPVSTDLTGWQPTGENIGPSALVESADLAEPPFSEVDETTGEGEGESEIMYFPEVLASNARPVIHPSFGMSEEEERIWKEELSHLTREEAAEILAVRTRIGSIVDPVDLVLPDWDDATGPRVLPEFVVGEARQIPLQDVDNEPGDVLLASATVESPVVRDLREQADRIYRENLANRMTTGFKRRELLVIAASVPSQPDTDAGDGNDHNPTWLTRIDLTQGEIRQTGNPLDVAISGRGWLKVSDGETEGFTRSGVLGINEAGDLSVWTGAGLLPLVPQVSVAEELEFRIMPSGAIVTNDDPAAIPADDQNSPRCVLHTFRNPSALKRTSAGLYVPTESSGEPTPQPANPQARFVPHALEQSNSDPEREQEELLQILTLAELIAGQP